MAFLSAAKISASKTERRAETRRRICIGAWLTNIDGSILIACQTSDVSALGVQVKPNHNEPLPKTLIYLDTRDRMAYQAEVRWQDKTGAGLKFIKAWRFADLADAQILAVVQTILT